VTDNEIKAKVKLVLSSYGLKTNAGRATRKGYTAVPVADMLVDCRCIKEKGIKGWGESEEFQAGVKENSKEALELIYKLIQESIRKIPERRSEKKNPFTEPFEICFCCAWGIHRSVAAKRIMAKRLSAAGYNVTLIGEPSADDYLKALYCSM